jgi:hypothetical protein
LSPASPPGFVTALTTARSRDVPAEWFDERLPRQLPYHGSPGALISLCPASSDDPIALAGHLLANVILSRPPPHPPRNDAANCNGYAAKKKPTDLKLYEKFRSTTPVKASKAMMMGWWIR